MVAADKIARTRKQGGGTMATVKGAGGTLVWHLCRTVQGKGMRKAIREAWKRGEMALPELVAAWTAHGFMLMERMEAAQEMQLACESVEEAIAAAEVVRGFINDMHVWREDGRKLLQGQSLSIHQAVTNIEITIPGPGSLGDKGMGHVLTVG